MKSALPVLPVLLLAPLAALLGAGKPASAGKPNIVVILADDLGYGDVQCYNRERGKIPTPNLDKLAAQGMRFTDAHSSSAVCTPSRYSILTGRYHWRTKLQAGVLDGFGQPLIAPGRLTLAGLARAHGYATACIGKWHLGMVMPTPITEGRIEGGPITCGFDSFFGISASLDMAPYAFIENDRFTEPPSTGKTFVMVTSDNGCAPYVGTAVSEDPRDSYEKMGAVADLEKLGHYPSGPLRGYKADAWEGGHRVPFIVRWPKVVRAGSVCDQLVRQADLMVTLAEIVGAKLPDNAGEDSFSLVPLLKGEDKPIRDHAVSASIGGTPALRSGLWKYIPAPGSGGWGKGGDQSQPVQLYNLADDVGETRNLAAAMPENVAEMKALLEKLIADGRSTPGVKQANDIEVKCYPAGPAAKPKTEGKAAR